MTTPADPEQARVLAAVERAHWKAILSVPEFEALEDAYDSENNEGVVEVECPE